MIPFRCGPAPAVFGAFLFAVPAAAAPAAIHYHIEARLDGSRGEVSGRASITWVNDAREPWQLSLCAANELTISDAQGSPLTVAPGARAVMELRWTTALPLSAGVPLVGDHWYPRATVSAAGRGAACRPATPGRTAPDDPADFEVDLSLPRGWLVAATGREQSASDGGAADTVHRYAQRGVREFTWVAGPQFVERRRRLDGPSPAIELRLLLLPEHASQAERLLDAAVDALDQHRRWLSPDSSDQLTMVDTGWRDVTGDRAYPGLVTFATRWRIPSTVLEPETAVARGISAQWWGGVVGIDAGADPELADGIRDYFAGVIVEHLFDVRHQRLAHSTFSRSYFGGFIPWAWRDVPVSRASAYRTRGARGFGTLERYLGVPVLQRALAAVIDRYRGERISAAEFFRVLGDAAGQDLQWFRDAVFTGTGSFDYAVQSVVTGPDAACGLPCFRTDVRVDRLADGQFTGAGEPPLGAFESGRAMLVSIAFADGQRVEDTWDGRNRSKSMIFRSRAPAESVRVDPARTLLLDGRQTNNSWTSKPRAVVGSARWSAVWATWLQDLLLSYATLV